MDKQGIRRVWDKLPKKVQFRIRESGFNPFLIEVDKWYHHTRYGFIVYVTSTENNRLDGYGVDPIKWDDTRISSHCWSDLPNSYWEEATTSQVKTALIKEAKNRGIWNNSNTNINGRLPYGHYITTFSKASNKLFSDFELVFDNGTWATLND